VFVIHEVAAVRAVIPGAREATMVSMIGTILHRPMKDVRVRSDHAMGSLIML